MGLTLDPRLTPQSTKTRLIIFGQRLEMNPARASNDTPTTFYRNSVSASATANGSELTSPACALAWEGNAAREGVRSQVVLAWISHTVGRVLGARLHSPGETIQQGGGCSP